jgi:hypothetical protein
MRWLILALAMLGCDDDVSLSTECDIAIVGGGAGGLHTAFRLAATMADKVCLFEKEKELGGRIHDVSLNENDADAPRIGTGARRVMEGQEVLFALATELGVTLESPPNTADLINARGAFSFFKDDFLPLYPRIQTPMTDHETFLYDALRMGPERANVTSYPDFRAYIRKAVGEEEYWFLHDMSRFRADFEYPLDARGYLDYLDEEWDVCCAPSYPVGGMSAFIRGMEAKATMQRARIFKEDPVSEISRSGDGYKLVTANHPDVRAKKVVIAIPPHALEHVSGDVVDDIKALPQYQDLIGVKVVTITQWWPENWWEQIKDPNLTADNQVWRAWTTEHCLNFIEIPLNPDAVAQKVTRSVYDDDINCVEFWVETAARGIDKVEAEIQRGLEHLFNNNGVTTPATVTIPKPLKTHVQVWPAGWYWLRAGARFTNAEIFEWAKDPLDGEGVALVGEAYHPLRSGWSDAAYKSSINLLMSGRLTGTPLSALRSLPTARSRARVARDQAGH